jgi:hypothetical protein
VVCALRFRRWQFVWVVCGVWGVASPALAQQRFEVPAACGTREEFAGEVVRLLGTDANAGALPDELTIEPTQGATGYRLQLTLGTERRELADPDCRTLFRSAVVITAAAARREALPTPPPQAADVAVETPAAATTAEAAVPAANGEAPSVQVPAPGEAPRVATAANRTARDSVAAKRAPPPTPVRLGVGLGAAVGIGTVPGVGPSVELDTRLTVGVGSAKVAASYWFAKRAERDGRGVRIDALALRATGGLNVTPYLNVALGVAVARLVGSGRSVAASSTDVVWDLLPVLEVAATPWKFRHFSVELGARGQVSSSRPRFVVTGYGDIYRVPLFGGEATIRVVFQTL